MSAAIFDMLERADHGSRGVALETFAAVLFPDNKNPRNAVRVHINRLNDFLQPCDLRVRMIPPRAGVYYLVERGAT